MVLSSKSILNTLPYLIYCKDEKGRYVSCNRAFLKLCKLDAEEAMVGKLDKHLSLNKEVRKITEIDKEILESGKNEVSREVELDQNGRHIVYLLRKFVFFDKKIKHLISLSFDITHYKEREHALEKEVEGLDQLLALMPGNVYWMDKRNVFLGCNENQRIFSKLPSRESIVGMTNYEMPWKDYAEEINDFNTEVMQSKVAKVREEKGELYGRGVVHLSRKVPWLDKQGNLLGLLGISFNITKEKEMEEALKLAKERAEQSDKAKSDFLANMSHDIRTPLVGMLGASEYLYQHMPEGELKALAEQLHYSTKSLLELSNSIIEFVQIESGDLPIEEERVDLLQQIKSVFDLLAPVAKRKGLKFIFEKVGRVSRFWRLDKKRLYRVILNLVGNAIKFTDDGFVKITLSSAPRVGFYLSVRDSGPGVPKDKREIIFERFTRLTKAYEGKKKGSGIGLSIVKTFLSDMGGSIRLNNRIRKGTEFICTIPAKKLKAGEEDNLIIQDELDLKMIQTIQSDRKAQSDYTILLVEDNDLAAFAAKNKLESFGFHVVVARDAQSALKQFKQNVCDLVLLDVGLPDHDGRWVARKIRALEKSKKARPIPVVGLSAHVDSREEKNHLASGMDEALVKPLDEHKLLRVLRQFLPDFFMDKKPEEKSLDLSDGTKKMGGDKEAGKRMLVLLAKSLPKDKKAIDAAFKKDDRATFLRRVHNLHGGLRYCGAPRLQKACEALEEALKTHRRKKLEDFAALYQNLLDEIEAIRREAEGE